MSQELPKELEKTLKDIFERIDEDGLGFISMEQLHEAFPGYSTQELAESSLKGLKGKINFDDFKKEYVIWKKQNSSSDVKDAEKRAYTNWINKRLKDDKQCAGYLPLNPETDDLMTKCKDGVILANLINEVRPETIDERVVNTTDLSKKRMYENLALVLNSAASIGCDISSIKAEDIYEGRKPFIMRLIWQIIRIELFRGSKMVIAHPELLSQTETTEEPAQIPFEKRILKWFNYHLIQSGSNRRVNNFPDDITDSRCYATLLKRIAPKKARIDVSKNCETDRKRAEMVLQQAEKIGCRFFVTVDAIVKGNYRLNLAFLANLFNNYPALKEEDLYEIDEEEREVRTYIDWINSLAIEPSVFELSSSLENGMVLCELFNKISPGLVKWHKVKKGPFRGLHGEDNAIANCNYCISLGRQMNFSLVSIDGSQIFEGDQSSILNLLGQMLAEYARAQLSKVAGGDKMIKDEEIIKWANRKLKTRGKKSMTTFQDPSIGTSEVIFDLIDVLNPGAVDYSLVQEGKKTSEKLNNSMLAISLVRKIGGRVFAQPEDIVEVKPKRVMTIFAYLMAIDLEAAKSLHEV